MIRRIGEVLGFEAEAVAIFVDVALLAGDGAVEKISGVELDAGLSGGDFHDAAAGRLVDAGGEDEALFVTLTIEDPVVVVAVAEDELVIVVADAGAPLTGRSSPVGIRFLSTGVKRSALIRIS
jgi:hypothetical protein